MERKELLKSKEFWIVKIQNQLYEQLENYLKENKISKTELAEKMGVSKGYVSQILNGDFDHKLSKLVEITMVMNKVPILNFENIDECIKIDKELGIENITERITLNVTINYDNAFVLENPTKENNSEYQDEKIFSFDQLKKFNLKNNISILN